ncbi:DNA repair protein RadC [Marivita sp. S6314]|uniref:RadC family protein n=1 Tax=Marivita sp. S6314 TaxID=2926406 RepID=UPI001FF6C0DC|nr:DNA repair protein RadC [Marivita sp. S6314]MCK0150190.1 DNA repair protein RadC [Marivita sp. S6314]
MSRARPAQLSLFEAAAPPPRKTGATGGAAPADTPKRKRVPSYLKDHRKRLRNRFLVGGADPMPDYELLELLLFRSLRNGDVKPTARLLIDTFGDFNAVLAAPIDRLQGVAGIGPETAFDLKLIEASAHRMTQTKLLQRDVISSWSALLNYCRASMAHRDTEHFRIFFLDRKNVLIADEMQAKGTVDHVPVYPREIIKRALDLNASALILVHNHPSGDPTPSQADITMTHDIVTACDAVGITVHDHLIIGKSRETSLKSEGYL